ncbi:glycosyltransferase [Brachybacterium vulturis]|uniref:glycosyltransferase n=1 Tax=Brachybacterium vulturis TaxID=2017484 RepID=UPI0037359E39
MRLIASEHRSDGARRLLDIVATQLRIIAAAPRTGLLYLRAHPLALPAVLFSRLLGCKVILEVNGSGDDVFIAHPGTAVLRPLLSRAGSLQYRLTNHVVTVTPGLARLMAAKISAGKITALTNGAPLRLSSLAQEPGRPPVVIFFGELASWQGIETVLAAKASGHWPDGVRLEIIGSGSMASAAETAAQSDPTLTFRGRLPQAEVHERVAESYATLSVQSGRVRRNLHGVAPLKVAESLMLGTPVILSDLGGHSDVLKGVGYRWIVPADSPVELAEMVGALVAETDAGTVRRDAISAIAQENLSWEAIGKKTADLIEGVIAETAA